MSGLSAFYLGEPGRQCFNLCFSAPARVESASVVVIPPFAEEMNRCRRMQALLGRALARRSVTTMVPDLFGTGDSEGDFGDADWDIWLDDLRRVDAWRRARCDGAAWWLGVRSGALLLPDLIQPGDKVVLWQPVLNGEVFLKQFLRLRVVADAMAGAAAPQSGAALIDALLQGEHVEVAGYRLSPGVARGLLAASFDFGEVVPACVAAFEVGGTEHAACSPALAVRKAQWAARGVRTEALRVPGPQFWVSQETVDCPALIETTVMAMEKMTLPATMAASGAA